MKTIPLRTLLRDPKSVKKLTGNGHAVRITDGGAALWDITAPSAAVEADKESRDTLWDEHYSDLLARPLINKGVLSMEKVLELSRGDR